MSETYNIPFTNKSDSISIEPYDVDVSTSLKLYGKNTPNYWSDLNNNVLLLLTNFSKKTPPVTPIKGQTWFDNSVNELKYYDDDWYRLVPPLVDLSDCVLNTKDTMAGNLEIPNTPANNQSIVSRSYVESKVLPYTSGSNKNVKWIRLPNNHTIMYTNITQNNQPVELPFPMSDTNYSIIATPNETSNSGYNVMHYTTYDKTVNGFNVHLYGNMATMAIVIMGFGA